VHTNTGPDSSISIGPDRSTASYDAHMHRGMTGRMSTHHPPPPIPSLQIEEI